MQTERVSQNTLLAIREMIRKTCVTKQEMINGKGSGAEDGRLISQVRAKFAWKGTGPTGPGPSEELPTVLNYLAGWRLLRDSDTLFRSGNQSVENQEDG